jgi:hypothetical protein
MPSQPLKPTAGRRDDQREFMKHIIIDIAKAFWVGQACLVRW